jgi:hypothetical protein
LRFLNMRVLLPLVASLLLKKSILPRLLSRLWYLLLPIPPHLTLFPTCNLLAWMAVHCSSILLVKYHRTKDWNMDEARYEYYDGIRLLHPSRAHLWQFLALWL